MIIRRAIVAALLLLCGLRAAWSAPLPDFDAWWDYDAPKKTQMRFLELLPRARAEGTPAYVAELLTQIARTESLQGLFPDAHMTLDEVAEMLKPDMKRARVRYLLERGRTFNSSGEKDKARAEFLQAWDVARSCGEDGLAVDAAHMLGIVERGKLSLEWNLKALELADKSPQPDAQRWKASLRNNIGWWYFDDKKYPEALENFQQALALRDKMGNAANTRAAKWCVGRALRALTRYEEALAVQQALQAEFEAANAESPDPLEEIAECLLALKREDEAAKFFARAYALLLKDAYVVKNEPERIARAKKLGRVP